MPVPVPSSNKSSTYHIRKRSHTDLHNLHNSRLVPSPVFSDFLSLSLSSVRVPHSLILERPNSTEEWLSSDNSCGIQVDIFHKPGPPFDSSRRGQGSNWIFQNGLIATGDVPISKGELAEACHPPVFSSRMVLWSQLPAAQKTVGQHATDFLAPQVHHNWPGSNDGINNWAMGCKSEIGVTAIKDHSHPANIWRDEHIMPCSTPHIPRKASCDILRSQVFLTGSFQSTTEDFPPTPGFTPEFPGNICDQAVQSVTPFADYVDKAVSCTYRQLCDSNVAVATSIVLHEKQSSMEEPSVDPDMIRIYRQMADPLSDWLAEYVWKICTTGFSLPAQFKNTNTKRASATCPPPNLSNSIRTLLCSTLLQSSGVFLALWYISRLPVFFDWNEGSSTSYPQEMAFREELFGKAKPLSHEDRNAIESGAVFRLILLGCMLSNKWLDDHTFSNKTWQTISDVPLEQINRLELLTLDLFSHDLSISCATWDQWLHDLRLHHISTSPFPSPIERPSVTDAKNIIRRMLEELISLQPAYLLVDQQARPAISRSVPRPTFIGISDRIKDRLLSRRKTELLESLEVDLDEDGPLRAEYMPRRRASGTGDEPIDSSIVVFREDAMERLNMHLPPPAKWSPAADPVIAPKRTKDRYIAVRPPDTLLTKFGGNASCPSYDPTCVPATLSMSKTNKFQAYSGPVTGARQLMHRQIFPPTPADLRANALSESQPFSYHIRSFSHEVDANSFHCAHDYGFHSQWLTGRDLAVSNDPAYPRYTSELYQDGNAQACVTANAYLQPLWIRI